MADTTTTKKFLSLEGLEQYDALIKQEIDAVNTSITNITSGTVVVKEAEHAQTATSADSAATAEKATTADSATSASTANVATKANQLATARTISLSGDASGSVSFDGSADVSLTVTVADDSHNHVISNVDGLQTALDAKAATTYVDEAVAAVKNDLLNGAGTAYDTLKELGDLIDDNKDAIDALEEIAAGKANATHTHAIADVSGLQSALDGKAASSHTHTVSQISDLTATAAELNVLDGITATTAELNYVDGVTSNIQTQLDGKAASSHSHTITATATDDDVIVLTGTNGTNKVTFDAKHATSGVTAGTYKSVTVNAYGHVTGGSNPTTISGYGITDAYTKTQVDSAINAAKTTVDSALSTSSANPVQNSVVTSNINTLTSAVSANTSSISSHSTAISNLQTAVDEIQEITSAEITALFNS